MNASASESRPRASLARIGMRLLRWLAVVTILLALAWGLSDGLRDPIERLFLACGAASLLVGVLGIDGELARARVRPQPDAVDRMMPPVAQFTSFATLAVGFLDGGRVSWSGPVPDPLRVLALLLFTAGMLICLWAVTANRFFMPAVRIQSERGHHVVTRGPYRFVRHPGYLGMLVLVPAAALALGSWWALLPAAAYDAIVLRRVLIEDRFLHQRLDGYPAYAAVVRSRLFPGSW